MKLILNLIYNNVTLTELVYSNFTFSAAIKLNFRISEQRMQLPQRLCRNVLWVVRYRLHQGARSLRFSGNCFQDIQKFTTWKILSIFIVHRIFSSLKSFKYPISVWILYFEVSEASMSHSSLTDYPFTWSLVLICVGAATTLLALVGVMTIVVKKWKSKPSRVSSVQGDGDRGTDV